MSRTRKTHLALFGNVRMTRAWCEECQGTAFVIQKKLACCDAPFDPKPLFYKRECEPEQARRTPCFSMQKMILESQGHSCFYCEQHFGAVVRVGRRRVRLSVAWDHLVPYSYAQNNSTDNFVAACQKCNGWKSNLMFQTIEEARVFVQSRWQSENKLMEVPDEKEA